MNRSGKRNPKAGKRIRQSAHPDDVGYGRPPREHQFKPGASGNPKGRPVGAKSQATIMHELLQQKLNLNERGKSRKITVYEGIFRRIVEDCLKGNVKSATFLLSRYDAINAGEPVESGLSQDDEAVLEAYIRKIQPKPSEDPQ